MWQVAAIYWIEKTALIYVIKLHNDTLHNLDNKTGNINTKNCSLSIVFTATDQKPQKIIKMSYYSASRWHSGDVMVGNVTFITPPTNSGVLNVLSGMPPKSVNQSINQSIKQSIDQSINRLIYQSINQSICLFQVETRRTITVKRTHMQITVTATTGTTTKNIMLNTLYNYPA